jgi:hypothetical protein
MKRLQSKIRHPARQWRTSCAARRPSHVGEREGNSRSLQAGAAKAFHEMLAIGGAFDRHVVLDPGERNIGLDAAELLQRGFGGIGCPAIVAAAVSTRWAPT